MDYYTFLFRFAVLSLHPLRNFFLVLLFYCQISFPISLSCTPSPVLPPSFSFILLHSFSCHSSRSIAASADGTLSIFDSRDPSSSSSLRSTFKSRVLEGNIVKIVWVPPEYGDAVACISVDGIVSLWEEVA